MLAGSRLQLHHLPYSLLDRRLLIQPMHIVQVNAFNPQPLETALTLLPAVFGAAIKPKTRGSNSDAKFGGKHDIGAALWM